MDAGALQGSMSCITARHSCLLALQKLLAALCHIEQIKAESLAAHEHSQICCNVGQLLYTFWLLFPTSRSCIMLCILS